MGELLTNRPKRPLWVQVLLYGLLVLFAGLLVQKLSQLYGSGRPR